MSHLARSLRVFVFTWITLISLNHAYAIEAPVRIMPLGDSITFGQSEPGAEGGYRDKLYTLLNSAGYNVDFVGTFSDANNPGLPDINHQGAPGFRVDEINAAIGGWLDAIDDPDVILIQIGTNDFLQVARNETAASVLAKLDALITNITTRRPFAKVIVSTLILSTYSNSVEAKQVAYNQLMPDLVAQHVALGHQVSLVDLHPALSAGDLYDTVHPKTTGYNKMADAWLPAVTNVIAPKGTANRPQINWAYTSSDAKTVEVNFSKPIADSSTTLSNFDISGGVTVTNAVLDAATKRTVTLTTSAQNPGTTYTLTVSGVQDRTTQQTLIAPQSKVLFTSNWISNGSFEDSYDGWPTHTGNQVIKDKTTNSPYTTGAGNKLVAFNTGDTSTTGTLSQTFPTVSGKTYYLSFGLGVASWTSSWTQKLDVNVQGYNTRLQTTATFTGNGGSSYSPLVSWSNREYSFTANSSTSTLTFTDTSGTSQSSSKDMLLDNVYVYQAGSPPTLAVTSTPMIGASVTITPNDLDGNGSATSGLIRSYNGGSTVTLTAPATSSGRGFQKWQLNGADIAGTNRTITVTLDNDTTLNAFYDPSGSIAPVAIAESYTTDEDTPLVVSAPGILLNDSDANALPLTAAVVTGPTKGSLNLNTNGSFTYTPNLNANGSDSFTYRANNGSQNSNIATVSLTVTPVNDPPDAVDDGSVGSPFLTVSEDSGASSTMQVLLNDSDPENNTLTITGASSPNGTVSTANTNTRLRFTPTPNFSGPTTISYTISDGKGGTATATVFIYVTNINDAPVANPQSVSVDEDTSLEITLTGTDVDSSNLTFTKTNPSHGTLTGIAPNLIYTPAANYYGPDNFTFTVNDGSKTSPPATVSITVISVNDAPVANAQVLSVNEDDSIAITLSGTDVDSANLTFTPGSPANGILTGTAPNLTYTPASNYNGQDSFTFTVSDGLLTSASATVSITVNPVNDAPVAIAQNVTTNEDTALGITLAGSDLDGDTLSAFTVTAQPQNGVLTGIGANRIYTPNANFNGQDTFTFTVSDASLQSASATVSITVHPVNDAPVAIAQAVTTAEDTAVGITLSGSDLDGDTLSTFNVTAQPQNGTLTGTAPDLTYTPAANYSGEDNFTFTVSDGSLTSEPATVSITVDPINDAPLAAADNFSTDEDIPLIVPAPGVLANDSDQEGTALIALLATNVTHGVLALAEDGGFTYTPAADFNGEDSFSYKANDGDSDSDIVTVTLTVHPIEDAPVANAQAVSLNEDGSLTITLTGSDAENSALTYTESSCSHGTLTGTAPDLTYTPAANYSGEDNFTFTVSDGSLTSEPATVSITVNPVNDAPLAVADAYSTDEDIPLIVPTPGVLGNDSDQEGTALIALLATNVTHGVLALAEDGGFTYTPATDFNGEDSFSYKANDGDSDSDIVTVTLTVIPVNDAPMALQRSISVDEDHSVQTTLTGNDIEGSTLTFAVSEQPAHGSVTLSGAVATYTPHPDYNGPDSFGFTVSDGQATSAPAEVTVTVNPMDEFTQWLEGSSQNGGPNDDPDGDSISNALEFVLGGNPSETFIGDLLPTITLLTADMDGMPGNEDYLLFSYHRTERSRIDPTTSVNVEWATDIAGPWHSADGGHGEMIATVPGDQIDQIKVYIPRTLAGTGPLFTRLKVVIDLPSNSPPASDE